MSDYFWRAGLGNVGSYQVSGFPWITGSIINQNEEEHIVFPTVTKSITVFSRANPDLRIHFDTANHPNVYANHHYVSLTTIGQSITMNIKCNELYISNVDVDGGSYEIFAELTGIERQNMGPLSGSGIND